MIRQKTIFYLLFVLLINSCDDSTKENEHVFLDTVEMEKVAQNFIDREEYNKAKLIYDTLIAFDSTKANYYFKRAYSKSLLMHNDSSAIADYQNAIFHGYQNKKSAYLSIGMLYKWTKKFDSAIYYFNECLRIDPKNSRAQKEKTEITSLLNNFE